MNAEINSEIQYLKSVGPKRAEAFNSIGIFTIRDLLFFFPAKYLDRTNILTALKVLQVARNGYEGEVTIIAEVMEKSNFRYGRKQILKVIFKDDTGIFECVWFQGIKYFQNLFNTGEVYALSSKPVITKYGHLQFVHPDFDKLTQTESSDFLHTGRIIPFYSIPKGLRSRKIGDLSLRRIINVAVESYANSLSETLPKDIIERNGLQNIVESVKSLHFPSSYDKLDAAKYRMKFEELFYIELLVALRKATIKKNRKPHIIKLDPEPINQFINGLPFTLTESQLKVLHEIKTDMKSPQPMNRLLQGDVGSGKTAVAMIAMLMAVENGLQAVIMAPTEILANQHFINFREMFKEFEIEIDLLIGGQRKKERTSVLERIENGTSKIIIGTHALFEDVVKFNNLGLVVIDEQHRFGVVQRSKLIAKGFNPDLLIMTATPIPRTLTLTLYGDLDISLNDKMPSNRKEIITTIRGESSLPDIYKFIIDKKKDGYQTYILYPLVEESEKLDLKDAVSYYENLSKTYFHELNVGLIHGKMKWQEKEEVMEKFASKEFDVLISTTVIEVGIDVPDANIMLINDAYRFGLSQLHQLRGRVGRSNKQAYCVLITKDSQYKKNLFTLENIEYLPPHVIEMQKASIRLNAMKEYSDGFKLSEIDMKLRGPGDIFGIKQSGFPELKYADITTDIEIIEDAKKEAFTIINDDPRLSHPNHLLVKNILLSQYKNRLDYAKTP